ncbi:MAG: helix-turn-helix domain-containing protein [Spirochaetaceae bacterium]|nr:MAG: helix-turn-helix domain-containing protein [Spirochaetaceae bacterium]
MQSKKLNAGAIESAMTSLGLNQSQIAKDLEVSREAVSQWFMGKKYPQPRLLLALSKILKLPFDELVIKSVTNQPVIAYRTNKHKSVSQKAEQEGMYMGQSLRVLLPYLKSDTVFMSSIIKKPGTDYGFIQQVVSELRSRNNEDNEELGFDFIMFLYCEFRIILVPVMWGANGHNGLYIHLPDKNLTFVYANLEKVITDFKFWLLHELAHAMTPSLSGDEREKFADNFAGAMLFPEQLAGKYYHNLTRTRNTGLLIQQVKSIASSLIISPYTVFKELNKYAVNNKQSEIGIDIGGAVTNFNKQIKNVSEIIFEESIPDAGRYIKKSVETFKTPFFRALAQYLHNEGKGSGIVQTLLNIPAADAKGVYKALLNEKDFA